MTAKSNRRDHFYRPRLEWLEHRLAPSAHDTLATAMPCAPTTSLLGNLADVNQVDLYVVQLNAGDEVNADLSPQDPGDLLGSLRAFNAQGQQIGFAENSSQDVDTRLSFDAPMAGLCYVGVASNGNYSYHPNTPDSGSGGLTSGAYRLTLTSGSILQTESSSDDSLGTAQPITGNTVLAGTAVNGTTEYYSFTTASAGGLTASVAVAAGAAFVPRLTLYGDSGQLLIQSDAVGPDSASAQIVQHLQPGIYYLGVCAAEPDLASGSQSYVLDALFSPALPAFQALPAGQGPDAVAEGDFNHDGNLDIVTANAYDNTVSVFLGNGDGTFQPAVTFTYAVGNDPTSVAVGDFTGNGNLDIVTANYADNTVSVLLGNGDGTFQTAITTANVGNGPYSVAVGDFTNDGHLDIVTANEYDNTVSVLLGNGNGTFQPAVAYAVGNTPQAVAVGQFTHDGHLDIVATNIGDNTVSVLLGNGDGTFQPATTYNVGSGPYSVAVGDFTPDGNLDIVTANNIDNTVSVLLGNGDGTFQPATTFNVGDGPNSVAVADLRDDGTLDIVTANFVGNTVSVLLGNGDGTFQPAVTYASGNGADGVAVGDFTPGHADIVATNATANTVSVLLGRGDGTFQAISSVVAGSALWSVATGDFNHDGNLDLVTANYGDNTVSVLLGRGDGTFAPAATYAVGNGPRGVAVEDLNGDGNLDIVTANLNDNTVSVLLGRGDGTFLPAVSYSVTDSSGNGQWPDAVAAADLTGNGILDIVTANDYDNTVSVLLGNGDGTFQPAVTYGVGDAPQSLVIGDFTHDGHLDLAVANYIGNTVSVLLGNGDGTFQPAVAYAVGQNPESITMGDFTGDGNLDLATANTTDNTVSVLLGNGDGTFQPAVAYRVGQDPSSVTVGDFTGNGNLDLATANFQDNTVSVLLGNGDGTFLPAASYPTGDNPNAVTVGDFNNAGPLDIVTGNYGDSTLSLLLGTGQSAFQPAGSYTVGNDPVAIAICNDGSGNTVDAVTANEGDNTVTVLLGNGDGTFPSSVTCAVGNSPVAVASGNDSAGNLVIATANAGDNTVSVLLGNVDGTFQPAVSYPVGNDPDAVAVTDFNGGLVLVAANAADNTVSVLQGNADDTFQPAVTYPVGDDPDAVALGIDSAGNLDIITANAGDGTISVLQETAAGLVLPAVAYPVGNRPDAVAVSPDSNGNLVVVTTNAADNTISVLRGNPGGAFQSVGTYPVGKNPDGVVIGYDNYGNFGIVTANAGDNTVSVLHANTEDVFQLVGTFAVGSSPSSLAAGAFNNIGNFNILTTNAATNTVSVLLAGAQFELSTPGNGIARQNIPYLQDLTGDGIPDELILDNSGNLLFRQGLAGAPDQFAPPVIINPGQPVRDVTLYQTAAGWAVAAIDQVGNTVSFYTWDATLGAFQSTVGFATGNLPVRIAAGDLTGNGLDDLVVANDFDNSVTIALQQPDGTFLTLTRPVGSGPSSIAFANLGGQDGPDIVVSDQVSGDFSVLYNDPAHSFSQQSRYRAGSGLFDISLATNDQTVLSQLQTVGVVAGPFTGSGSDDVITLNRGAESFTLFRDEGQGLFPSPQPADTYFPTSAQAGQIASFTLPGETLPSVAILMPDLDQIWIYHNNGDGSFAPPVAIDAGNDPSGFSVVTVNGQLALLVGNAYGDILTLIYDGNGFPPPNRVGPFQFQTPIDFAPDRANLQSAPLAVGTIAGTGQQFAVVAAQGLGQVSLYYRIAGTDRFGVPVPISATGPLPQFAPGAVQTFVVGQDVNPYLVVANSLSNDVLLYHYDPAAGQFALLGNLQVGDDPVSITVADVNGDGIPDLLVANKGSNDVSVLIGSVSAGQWTATPYQRLGSDGSGPVAVAVQNTGGPNGPNLLVTNSDGKVALLPGIGSNGTGSGFFQDVNPQTFNLDSPIGQSVEAPNGDLFVVGTDGSLHELAGGQFTTLIDGGVATVTPFDTFLVAGFDNGSIGLLSANGTVLASIGTDFTNEPSALEALRNGNNVDIYATQQGSDLPIIVTLPIPVLTELPAVANAGGLSASDLLLVATLVPGSLVEAGGSVASDIPALPTFAAFIPQESGEATTANGVAGPTPTTVATADLPPQPPPADESSWDGFLQGIADAIRRRFQSEPSNNRSDEIPDLQAPMVPQLQLPHMPPPARVEAPCRAPQDFASQSQPAFIGEVGQTPPRPTPVLPSQAQPDLAVDAAVAELAAETGSGNTVVQAIVNGSVFFAAWLLAPQTASAAGRNKNPRLE